MSVAVLLCGDLDGPCPSCGGAVSLHVAETVEGDQVVWTAMSRCGDCGYTDEMRASPVVFDKLDTMIRQALIARVGLARLHVAPDGDRARRLRSFAVLRGRGATIAEVATAYAALTGNGLIGTPAEMSVLAEQLTAAGIQVTLQPYDTDRGATA